MSQATAEQAITTVEALPAELRAELVTKREAGTTLAELKKGYPQVAPDVIRAVLPPLPRGIEPKPATRKPQAPKPAKMAKPAQAKPKPAQPAKAKQPAQPAEPTRPSSPRRRRSSPCGPS
jgi:hypothetical protein